MSHNYPVLGSVVSYARADDRGEVHTGTGQAKAIFVGPDKRLMVQVQDGADAWNIDAAMIDATPQKVEEYRTAVTEVQAMTDEGNTKVRDTVDAYNDKVAGIYKRVLGDFVEIDMPVGANPAPVAG